MVAPQSAAPAEPIRPVCVSLVVTLKSGAPAAAAALAALRTRDEIALGERRGPWLPLVAETPFPRELHRWVESLPGVAHVDVAFVELPDDAPPPASMLPSSAL